VAINEGAIDKNKTVSSKKAILLFFKDFFPRGYTWKDVVDFIKSKKDPVG